MVVMLGKQEHLGVCGSKRSPRWSSRAASRSWWTPPPSTSSGRARGSLRGADLVIYSGGKFLRGPQTSGLLLGNRKLVQAAWCNASPHQALGRPMKVSKEDMIGVLTAVEYWFEERDENAELQRWYDDLQEIAAAGRGQCPAWAAM